MVIAILETERKTRGLSMREWATFLDLGSHSKYTRAVKRNRWDRDILAATLCKLPELRQVVLDAMVEELCA